MTADSRNSHRLRRRVGLVAVSIGLLTVAAVSPAWSAPAEEAPTGIGQAVDEDIHDAVEEEHGDSPPLLSLDLGAAIWNLIIFLCLLAILSKFVWPSVLGGLRAREDKIRGDLSAAEQTHEKAQSLLAEYERKLADASAQVQTMLADARRDAETSGQRIVDDARQEAERQRDRAVADIDTAKQVAMADLANQTTKLAMQMAGSVVGRELNPNDHADLIRNSLDRLPSNN